MESSSTPDSASVESLAAAYYANERFHQRFNLSATTEHDELTFSYADMGCEPGDSPAETPTILYIPGMFASRYLGIYPMHAMGEKLGVRVLVVDRPGMGHSTDVPLAQRITIWLELVPQLLKHLGIEHVALLSHSAGTIYCLNTLYHLRDILHPDRPAVTLLAPWVHPAHSKMTTMQVVERLPNKVFDLWHHIPRFFVTKAEPFFAPSGTFLTKISNTIFPSVDSGSASGESISVQEKNLRTIQEEYGLSRDMQIELAKLTATLMFGEATVGANGEAMMCVKKGPIGMWGICDDYPHFVQELVNLEKSRKATETADVSLPRLKIRVYFAETDALIGKQGQSYMEECWKEKDGEFHDLLDFASETISGKDHDSLCMAVEVLERTFKSARGDLDDGTT